jgi:hypothetical protein
MLQIFLKNGVEMNNKCKKNYQHYELSGYCKSKSPCDIISPPLEQLFIYLFIYLFVVLGLELSAFSLSHSTSPIFVKGILRYGLANYLPRLASNCDPPHLCLLNG